MDGCRLRMLEQKMVEQPKSNGGNFFHNYCISVVEHGSTVLGIVIVTVTGVHHGPSTKWEFPFGLLPPRVMQVAKCPSCQMTKLPDILVPSGPLITRHSSQEKAQRRQKLGNEHRHNQENRVGDL